MSPQEEIKLAWCFWASRMLQFDHPPRWMVESAAVMDAEGARDKE